MKQAAESSRKVVGHVANATAAIDEAAEAARQAATAPEIISPTKTLLERCVDRLVFAAQALRSAQSELLTVGLPALQRGQDLAQGQDKALADAAATIKDQAKQIASLRNQLNGWMLRRTIMDVTVCSFLAIGFSLLAWFTKKLTYAGAALVMIGLGTTFWFVYEYRLVIGVVIAVSVAAALIYLFVREGGAGAMRRFWNIVVAGVQNSGAVAKDVKTSIAAAADKAGVRKKFDDVVDRTKTNLRKAGVIAPAPIEPSKGG